VIQPGDELLEWREEAFGERPVLGPWGDPFFDEEPLDCGVDEVETCDVCN
jgi:hypothetical protein